MYICNLLKCQILRYIINVFCEMNSLVTKQLFCKRCGIKPVTYMNIKIACICKCSSIHMTKNLYCSRYILQYQFVLRTKIWGDTYQ